MYVKITIAGNRADRGGTVFNDGLVKVLIFITQISRKYEATVISHHGKEITDGKMFMLAGENFDTDGILRAVFRICRQ